MNELIKLLLNHYNSGEPIYVGMQIANCIIHTYQQITELTIDDCCINITSNDNEIYIPIDTPITYDGEEFIINNQLFINDY